MERFELEIRQLKELNSELAQKLQHWKVTAAQKESEKLKLVQENADLRMKIIRLKKAGAMHSNKLTLELKNAGEEALSHLVVASTGIAKAIEMAKSYSDNWQKADILSPRQFPSPRKFSRSPANEKVLRVPPMLMGGKFIQPVVSLNPVVTTNRPPVNTSNSSPTTRTPNQNRRQHPPLPIHMLQDAYIPLTRIDVADFSNNSIEASGSSESFENSANELGLENDQDPDADTILSGDEGEYDSRSEMLAVISERSETSPEVNESVTPPRPRPVVEDPLEGPSWLLDEPNSRSTRHKKSLEPDSTTEVDESRQQTSSNNNGVNDTEKEKETPEASWRRQFTPTVRRKRPVSPTTPPTPTTHLPPAARAATDTPTNMPIHGNITGRVLKVLVPKMRLEETPPKRACFDAPSPNGSTDSALIVSEAVDPSVRCEPNSSRNQHKRENRDGNDGNVSRRKNQSNSGGDTWDNIAALSRHNRRGSDDSVDSRDSHESRDSRDSHKSDPGVAVDRPRRRRKPIVYKEKPLNVKMRR